MQQKEAQAQSEREHYFALKQKFEPNDSEPPRLRQALRIEPKRQCYISAILPYPTMEPYSS